MNCEINSEHVSITQPTFWIKQARVSTSFFASVRLSLVLFMLGMSAQLIAEDTAIKTELVNAAPSFESGDDKENAKGIHGWLFSFDNDILVPSSRDQDYTYGINLKIEGDATKDYWLSLDRPLGWLNRLIAVESETSEPTTRQMEIGAYGFTPENIDTPTPDRSDRPYASIIYTASTRELATKNPNVVLRTNFTVGALGLGLVGNVQNSVHKLVGGEKARGWDHQISEGGEPTARYSIARQQLRSASLRVEVKTTAQVSVGYITEASYGLSLRFGRLSSRWQSFNPELASYGEQTNQATSKHNDAEHYWMLGAAIKARVYNAFFQGQFRDSSLTYTRSELNIPIAEAWVGYSHAFNDGLRLTYLLRGHTSEVKDGVANRNLVWGGLTLSRAFSS